MAVVKFRNPNHPNSEYEDWEEEEDKDDEGFIDEQIEENERSKERRMEIVRLFLRCLVVAFILLLIGLFFRYLNSKRVYSVALSEKIYEMSLQDNVTCVSLGDSLVYYSKDGATCLNGSGSVLWSISFEMQDPLVSKAGDLIAIGDYGGSTVYLESESEVLGTIDTNLPLLDLCVSENGEVAAVLSDTDTIWIYLFNSEGETIAYIKTTMSQSGYPLCVSLSPNGELLCVSHLTADSAGLSSSIAFYNFGEVGQNYAENNVSGFNYEDEVFPYTRFMNSSTCVAVSDSRIVFYTGKEIPQSGSNAMFDEELEGVYGSDDYVALLFPDSSGSEEYCLQVYDTSGQMTAEIPFTMEYTGIQVAGENVYINNDTDLLIYTVSGQLRYDGTLPATASQVVALGQSVDRFYLVTEDAIEKVTLQ